MAYTYDDFIGAATGAGMLDRFSREELGRIRVNPEYGLGMVKLYQDADRATTPEQKLLAQEAQNQLKRTYASAAVPSSAVPAAAPQTSVAPAAATAAPQTETAPAATTGAPEMPSFRFDREQELKDLTDKALNTGPFQYRAEEDPGYANARKQYLREAERARQDTLARAAAATGGTPSSYAVTAAQQAGDYHLTQLADREAALEETAYQRYLQDYQKTLSDLDVLAGQRELEYREFLQQQELEKEALNNAMNLYNTYKNKMTIDQLRQLLSSAGYLTPAVEVFLGSMAQKKKSGSSQKGSWTPDENPEEATDGPMDVAGLIAAEIGTGTLDKVYPRIIVDQKLRDQTFSPADDLWYRGANPQKDYYTPKKEK